MEIRTTDQNYLGIWLKILLMIKFEIEKPRNWLTIRMRFEEAKFSVSLPNRMQTFKDTPALIIIGEQWNCFAKTVQRTIMNESKWDFTMSAFSERELRCVKRCHNFQLLF